MGSIAPADLRRTSGGSAALHDAVRATAAARLARRQAEAAFIAAMRVVVRILVALLGRETLATLLPRFERGRAA